jgi:UDP-glucose 4-epimerase
MRALVTGGAGFIGSNLVRLLIEEGHDVVVLDNLTSGYRENLSPYPDLRVVEGDVRHDDDLRSAIQGCEVVFHLAASVGNTRSIEQVFIAGNRI